MPECFKIKFIESGGYEWFIGKVLYAKPELIGAEMEPETVSVQLEKPDNKHFSLTYAKGKCTVKVLAGEYVGYYG